MAPSIRTKPVARGKRTSAPDQSTVSGSPSYLPAPDDSIAVAQRMQSNPQRLLPNDVLYLQRTIGNAAVQRMLAGRPQAHPGSRENSQVQRSPLSQSQMGSGTGLMPHLPKPISGMGGSAQKIQRYEDENLKAGQVELPTPDEQVRDKMFVRHTIDPTVKTVDKGTEWEFSNVSNPNLRVAADRSIAIQDTELEPQEFYATNPVIAKANKSLTDHDALISLVPGPTMRVRKPHERGEGEFQTLKRVKPKTLKVLEDEHVDEYEKLTDHLCISLASSLMGLNTGNLKHRAIFQGEGEEESGITGVNIESDPTISNEVQSLAGSLVSTDSGSSKSTFLDKMRTGKNVTGKTGEDYGKQIAGGTMTNKAKKVGINEFAIPKIGEGYSTYSTVTETSGKNFDYTKLIPKERPRIWGYHYATVVAESEDAKDKVTLENYNRLGDQFDAYFEKWRDTFKDLGEDVEKAIKAVKEASGSNRVTKLQSLHAELSEKAGKTKLEAMNAIKTGWAKSRELALQVWYFRMYGTEAGKGQTFHERNTSGEESYYSNAMTVRVGAREDTTYDRTSSRFTGIFNNNPGDHASIRIYADYMKDEAEPAAKKITKAKGVEAKRTVFTQELRNTKARQMRLHYKKVIDEANTVDADNRAGDMPVGKAPMLVKLQSIADGCTSKRGRLNSVLKKGRRANLVTTRNLILGIRTKVGELYDYYAKYGV